MFTVLVGIAIVNAIIAGILTLILDSFFWWGEDSFSYIFWGLLIAEIIAGIVIFNVDKKKGDEKSYNAEPSPIDDPLWDALWKPKRGRPRKNSFFDDDIFKYKPESWKKKSGGLRSSSGFRSARQEMYRNRRKNSGWG